MVRLLPPPVMRALRQCLLLLLWALGTCACAQDAILERGVLEDPGGRWSLADVQAREFTPYRGVLQRGFSRSVFWVRLKVQAACTRPVASGCGDPWLMRIQPGNLDEIAVFDGAAAPPRVGDRHRVGAQPYRSLNHNVLIAASAEPRWIWLRLQTANTKLMDVEVLPLDVALQRDLWQGLATSLLISTLVVFFGWSALHWALHRDALIGLMAFCQFVVLAYALAYLGYIRLLAGDAIPPAWQDQFTNLIVLTTAPAQIAFHLKFLREFHAPKAGLRLLGLLLCLYPPALLGLALGYTREALQLNSMLSLIAPPILLLMAWGTREADSPVLSRRVLIIIYASMIVVLWISLLPILGVPGFNRVTVYSLPAYGFLNGLILVAILQLRAKRLQALHRQTAVNLQLAQQRVETEVQQRRHQTQFMDMLTHELKTPLGVMRMAWGLATSTDSVRARADRAIQDMTAVIDRCALATTLDDQGLASSRGPCDVPALLAQIAASLEGGERIRLQTGGELPVLQTDPPLLRSVLANLLDNALKYAAAESRIDVDARALNGGVAISVASLPGRAGWPDAQRVFQRYYRSAAAQHQSGSGLGLYLAATLAQRLGGVLHYAPNATHVRFELWLPL